MSSNRSLREVFTKLAGSSRKPARRPKLRLGVEPLEDRIVPATFFGPKFGFGIESFRTDFIGGFEQAQQPVTFGPTFDRQN